MSKQSALKKSSQLVLLSLVILLVGGGAALLFVAHQPVQKSLACDSCVVGPPSLPAATVDAIFRQLGSPMAGAGKAVEQAARQANLDDAFALAVWWVETNDGAAGVGLADRNPGSVRGSVGYPSAFDGYTIYPSYADAINYWFPMLNKVYIDRGLTTVYAISHPYVGTSTSDLWAGKVVTYMQRYRAEAPPPTPAPPSPTATIPPDMLRHQKQLAASNQIDYSRQVQNQGQDQEALALPNTSAPGSTSPLSPVTLNGIVMGALLMAVTLALWAFMLNRKPALPRKHAVAMPDHTSGLLQPSSFQASFTGAISFQSVSRSTETLVPMQPLLPSYNTDTLASTEGLLPAFPAAISLSAQTATAKPLSPIPPLFANPRGGGAFPVRRAVLLPSQPAPGNTEEQPVPVLSAAQGRSGGLLTRYRETQQQA